MNLLVCSAGRRAKLIQDFKRSQAYGKVVAADCSRLAPALYSADKRYLVSRIDDPAYVQRICDICRDERIDAVITCIDPEIELLARHRKEIEATGALALVPSPTTAGLCFDKYRMALHLTRSGVPVVPTYGSLDDALCAIKSGELDFPLFVKPRNGSGSVGARPIHDMGSLEAAFDADASLIAQPHFGDALDIDADAYVDAVSGRLVSVFTKRKLSTTIGGANKTVSFTDDALVEAIRRVVSCLEFRGPIDMDFFCRDGAYYLSEVNPRFGGAYLHAFGAGVDFFGLIENNVRGRANEERLPAYDEGIYMLMYDEVAIVREGEMVPAQPGCAMSGGGYSLGCFRAAPMPVGRAA